MTPPDPSDGWLDRLVEELNRTPPDGWVAVAARPAAADPARLADVLEATALLAADKAAADAPPGADAWRAVVAALAKAHPDHAAAVRECGDIPEAVAGDRVPDASIGEHALRPGARLGPFVVREFVAGGGMGEVYKAAQDDLDRVVALKVIRAGAAGPLARARFHRERLVLARLHQSNIVPVYFAGTADDLLYYAMQYVPGAPLSRVVTAVFQRASTAPKSAQTPPLAEVVGSILKPPPRPAPSDETQVATQSGPPTRYEAEPGVPVRLSAGYFRSAAAALAQVAEAIQHGHDTGFLHRDIKPSNLILDARGVCMVIDYGLARACGAAPLGAPNDPAESVLTHGGVGTPQYMAPEQFEGKADARSDVWGLGATLYELLTLRPAFAAGKWSDVERGVRHDTPTPVAALVPTVPRDLAAVCGKALAKGAADRYQTAGEFAADLRRWLRWEPTRVRPGWATLRPLRLWACRHVGAAAAVLLAVAAVAATAFGVVATANARTAVAQAEAAEERKAREFAAALGAAEELRRKRPYAGWSDALKQKLDAARKISPDAPLADAYAATLSGPDAREERAFELPGDRDGDKVITGFSSVAFGPTGRIACGGLEVVGSTQVHRTPGMVFDRDPKAEPVRAGRAGTGPVAFADADTPLQLILPSGADRTAVLWNLAANRAVAELPLPAEPARLEALVGALSADGRRAAVSLVGVPDAARKKAGAVAVWDVDPKGGTAKRAAGWDGPATALAFSPDGRLVAAGADDGGVSLRDAATGAEVAALAGERVPVLSLAFGRNYRADATGRARPPGPAPALQLAAGYDAGTAAVWNLASASPHPTATCRGASYYVNALTFTPDGAGLIAAGLGAPLTWDVSTGQPVFSFPAIGPKAPPDFHLTGAAVSADGRRVAFVGTNKLGAASRLRVFELDADRGVGVYRGLVGQCRHVRVSPSGGLVAGMSDNWQVAVWDRATGRVAWVWDVPRGWTADNADVAFDEPAGVLYVSTGETALRLNLTTGAREQAWPLRWGLNDALGVRPGRPPLLARRELTAPLERDQKRSEEILVRELLPDGTTRRAFAPLSADSGAGAIMSFEAGAKYLIVHHRENRDFRGRLYDAATGALVPTGPPAGLRLTNFLQLSADGTRLTAVAVDGAGVGGVAVFRFPGMTLIRRDTDFPVDGTDDAGALGATVTAVNGRAGASLYRLERREPVATFDAGLDMSAGGRPTPDGRFFAWGREDGSVRVADVPRTLERLAALTGR